MSQFVVKPVKRAYAFEMPQIQHGLQWVLKVRHPAAGGSTLPAGLSGRSDRESFTEIAAQKNCKSSFAEDVYFRACTMACLQGELEVWQALSHLFNTVIKTNVFGFSFRA